MSDLPMHEGHAVAPLSRASIKKTAQHARKVLGLPDGRIDTPRFLDDLTSFGIYYDVLDRSSDMMPAGVEACYVPEERTLYIRDTIYDAMCRCDPRAQFTIGHELGHAILAHRRTYNRQVGAIPVYCNSEWQANTFAAEFVMPVDEINRRVLHAPQAIASHFGVSISAAKNRLSFLEKNREIKKPLVL